MFIHQTLESSRYLEHRPVFLQPPQVCLQSRDKGVAFPALKEGTHGGHTHESGADDGRGLNPETCFARKHLSSKTRWLRNALAASTGFCPGMSNLCPSPHRLPVLTDSRFLTPQSGFPPHNARNLPEKRSRCYPASDQPDIIRWRRYSEVFISGKLGRVSACLVCSRVRAGG